jgi:gamma-glutamylcysteine synthetase
MAKRSDEFRKQVNDLWKQAIDQLEEVKEVVLRAQDRFETDLHKLRLERDKLLRKLGEQTYKLANQGHFPVPDVVKQTVDRLNEVIDAMVKKQQGKKAKKSAKKKAAKKKATKKKKAAKKKTAGRTAKRR